MRSMLALGARSSHNVSAFVVEDVFIINGQHTTLTVMLNAIWSIDEPLFQLLVGRDISLSET